MLWPYLLYAVGGLLAIVVLYNTIVVVGGTEIAVLERRWFGKSMPEGRVVCNGK
jgi:hypothetical protein